MTSEMKDKRRQIAEIRVQRPLLTFRIQILSLEKSTGPGQVHTDEFRAIRFRCGAEESTASVATDSSRCFPPPKRPQSPKRILYGREASTSRRMSMARSG